MQPARRDFTVRKGDDSEALSIVLKAANVVTGRVYRIPAADVIVTWRLGTTDYTSASNGGLAVDADQSSYKLPLSAAQTAALAASTPYAVSIAVGGKKRTLMVGSVIAQG